MSVFLTTVFVSTSIVFCLSAVFCAVVALRNLNDAERSIAECSYSLNEAEQSLKMLRASLDNANRSLAEASSRSVREISFRSVETGDALDCK